MSKSYLNEENLYHYIRHYYPDSKIEENKRIKIDGRVFVPDYRLPQEKIIFEFNGYGHYVTPKSIKQDSDKSTFYYNEGYISINIPYFIQMDEQFQNIIFRRKLKNHLPATSFLDYPHGFIDKDVVMPAAFCEYGLDVFYRNLYELIGNAPSIFQDIITSLVIRGKTQSIETVFPYSWIKDNIYNDVEKIKNCINRYICSQ
jgi:hypothetical protein